MEQQQSLFSRLGQFLSIAEKIALAGTFAGLLMKYLGKDGDSILMISLSTLAGIYYLMAFTRRRKPDDSVVSENEPEKPGFAKLLFATVLPKIIGISCAVAIVGILFALLHMPGAKEMLMIGATASVLASLILLFGTVTDDASAADLKPFLFRVIPCAVISVYFLMKMM